MHINTFSCCRAISYWNNKISIFQFLIVTLFNSSSTAQRVKKKIVSFCIIWSNSIDSSKLIDFCLSSRLFQPTSDFWMPAKIDWTTEKNVIFLLSSVRKTSIIEIKNKNIAQSNKKKCSFFQFKLQINTTSHFFKKKNSNKKKNSFI